MPNWQFLIIVGPFFISWLLHFCFYISLDSRIWAALSLREGLLCFSQSALYNSASRHCSVDDPSVSSSPGALQPEGQQQPSPEQSYSPPSISQSTMKRVTIRARALIPAGSILLLNGLKQHNLPAAGRSGRGQNLAACASLVLDSKCLHWSRAEDCFIDRHQNSLCLTIQLLLHVWGS